MLLVSIIRFSVPHWAVSWKKKPQTDFCHYFICQDRWESHLSCKCLLLQAYKRCSCTMRRHMPKQPQTTMRAASPLSREQSSVWTRWIPMCDWTRPSSSISTVILHRSVEACFVIMHKQGSFVCLARYIPLTYCLPIIPISPVQEGDKPTVGSVTRSVSFSTFMDSEERFRARWTFSSMGKNTYAQHS